jgi:2-haloacid dehalogenase
MKYRWLLFDADDTLFDFARAEENALKWSLKGSGIAFQPEYVRIYSRVNQQVWKEFEQGLVTSIELRIKRFQLFFEQTGIQNDPASFSVLYLQNLARGTDLLEGAESLVHTLKPHYGLALVTNGLKDVQRPRLEKSRLHDCFQHVFISEEIGAAKPSRAYFETVFSRLGNPGLNEVLIIGDSPSSDILGGLDFGIDTCWFNPAGKSIDLPSTYQITRLGDLLDLLQ